MAPIINTLSSPAPEIPDTYNRSQFLYTIDKTSLILMYPVFTFNHTKFKFKTTEYDIIIYRNYSIKVDEELGFQSTTSIIFPFSSLT